MKPFIQKTLSSSIAAIFGMCIATTASGQTLSQTPLEASVSAEPNIMINMDDSGSMQNITFDSGYDSSGTYQSWIFNYTANVTTTNGLADAPLNLGVNWFNAPTCPTNAVQNQSKWVEGTFSGVTRCIKVQAPIDPGTRLDNNGTSRNDYVWYSEHYMQFLFHEYSLSASNADLTINGVTQAGAFRAAIPPETRLQAVKVAAKTLVQSRRGIRWCTSELDHNTGSDNAGLILEACQDFSPTFLADLITSIDGLQYPGGTPVTQSHYGVTRYFRDGYEGNASPVQYRCQQNYAMMITDGLPNGDFTGAGQLGLLAGETRANYGLPNTTDALGNPIALPNWDDQATPTTTAQVVTNVIPAGSDGHGNGGEGSTLFLDDFALFAKEIDFFDNGDGLDDAGEPWGDATNAAEVLVNPFTHQNMLTYTIGLGIDNTMLDEAAANGSADGLGVSYTAGNQQQLSTVLEAILLQIGNRIGSSASSTATAAFLSGGNQVFQVKYDTAEWSGTLNSFTIESDPNDPDFGELSANPIWTTNDKLVYTNGVPPSRNAFVLNRDTGLPVELTWGNLSTVQQQQFRNDSGLLDYVLGDQSDEIQNGGGRRFRGLLLGDIVHSQPVYAGIQDFGYSDPSYETFLTSIASRTPMVYVGANDGFMHGFQATPDNTGGTELLAYMPSSALPYLKEYDNGLYNHHYSVDGKNVLLDAQIEKNSSLEWATLLLSSMGAGAKGLFALDVTDPDRYSNLAADADEVLLWEISNTLPFPTAGATTANVALTATATQSSTANSGAASRAIDGNTNGNYSGGSVSHTGNGDEQWLEVELDRSYAIDNIQLFNRTDCCMDRLKDYSVFVSDEPFGALGYEALKLRAGVTEFRVDGATGSSTTFETENISGKYVRVMREVLDAAEISAGNSKALSLAEIQINAITNPSYPELGNILDRPSIVRVGETNPNPSWYAITGNGVHSENGHAVFYIVDLNTGQKFQEIVLDTTGNNGIVSHTAVDLDGDDYIDRVYATDLKGNLWRINWNDSTGLFESEYTETNGDPLPMFTATNTGSSVAQPITVAPEVLRFPGGAGALMVMFGTGKYYDTQDKDVVDNEPKRTFYGVVDTGQGGAAFWTTLDKSDLELQEILNATAGGNDVRAVTQNAVDYDVKSGWFIDLPTNAERVVFEPLAIRDRVLFTTIIPQAADDIDPCEPNVTGWLMEVDAFSGGSPESVVFDTNGDGDFSDATDSVTIGSDTFQVAGIQPSAGAPLPPALIRVEPGPNSTQSASIEGLGVDSAGNLYKLSHEAPISRTSWRRLN